MSTCYVQVYALARTIFLLFATWLSLARGDVVPTFLRQPKTSRIMANTEVTIYCEVAPSGASVSWIFNGEPLKIQDHAGLSFQGTNLYFSNFEYSTNQGSYHCKASTRAGAILSEPLVLNIPVLKSFPPGRNMDIAASVGGTAVIPCPSTSSSGGDVDMFVKNVQTGQLLDRTTAEYTRLPSGGVLIKNVLQKHSGQYRCVMVSSLTGTNQTSDQLITLTVNSQGSGSETLIVDTRQEKALPWLGKSALLECPVVSRGILNVTWEKYGGQLPANRSRVEYGNLRIQDLQIEDAGTYICKGTTNNRKKLIAMEVQELVTAQAVSSEIVVNAGERVELHCDVIGRPEPKVTWYHNAKQIARPSTVNSGGFMFVINKVAPSHGGLYQCQAENNVSSASAVMKVEVKGQGIDLAGSAASNVDQSELNHIISSHLPYFTLWPTSLAVNKSANVAIPCLSVNSKELTWFKDNQPLTAQASNSRNYDIAPSGSLQLFHVSVKDSGKYSCIIRNENGSASAHGYLRVLDETTMGVTERDQTANNETTYENVMETTKPKRKKNKKNRKKKRRKKGKKRKKHRKGKNREVKLVPPSRPHVEQLSDTSVMLNWTVPQNDGLPIVFFRIQYKEVKPNKASWHTDDMEIDKDTTMYEVKNLKAGGTYKFRIAAVYSNNDNEVGQNSRPFEIKIAPVGKPHRPVDKPTIVEALPLQKKEEGKDVFGIGMTWQYKMTDTSPIEGFFIFYKPYDSKVQWKSITILETKVRSHVLTDLNPDTEYSIRMLCFNSAGNSENSNTVVMRTLAVERPTDTFMTSKGRSTKPPPRVQDTHTSGRPDVREEVRDVDRTSTQKSSEMLYMGIGIAMGVMLLLLVVFIVMCWWKQRQERLMMGMNGVIHAKFQDQAQRIYSESMRKKYMNGYPLNGLNGLVANGHGPHGNGSPGNKVNINVNPMSQLDTQMFSLPAGKVALNQTIVPNGSVPHYNSDSNFNSINNTKSGDEIPPDQPLLAEHRAAGNGDVRIQDPNILQRQGQSINSLQHQPSSQPGHSSNEADLSGAETRSQTSPTAPRGLSYFGPPNNRHMQSFDGGTNPSMFSARNTMDSLSPSDHVSGSHGKHKRRRKRPQSREHTTKDQATNTDLSSNEGTIEFTTFNKSPSSSEKSQSFTNCSTQCTDYSHMNGAL